MCVDRATRRPTLVATVATVARDRAEESIDSMSHVRAVVRERGTVADVECVVVASAVAGKDDDDGFDDDADGADDDGFGLTSASVTVRKRNAAQDGRRGGRRKVIRIARVTTAAGGGEPTAGERARAFATARELTPAFASRVAKCNLGLSSGSGSGSSSSGGRARNVRRGGRVVVVVKRRCARIGTEFWVVAAGGESVEPTSATMSFWVSEREGGSDEALKRAVGFTTTAAFDAWSRGSKCVAGPKRAGLGGSRERAKKHPYAYRGVMGDDVIDCVCGDNEEYGFMVACETCGAWEHGECCRIYAEEEIPKDYKCSACVRADAKTLLVLDLREENDDANDIKGEQVLVGYDGEDSVDGGFGTVKSVVDVLNGEMTVVCCLCGCHDAHGDYAAMVQACSCAGGGAIAHESCMKRWCGKTLGAGKGSNARGRALSRAAAATCKACGDHGGLASGISDASDVDDLLSAFAKAIDDTSAKYEAEAMAYRSNPRPRPRLASDDSTSKKENIAKQETTTATMIPEKVKTPVTSTRDPSKKFEGTPVSMLPLKRRRMMAWDSEQKMRSLSEKMDAKALSENVK